MGIVRSLIYRLSTTILPGRKKADRFFSTWQAKQLDLLSSIDRTNQMLLMNKYRDVAAGMSALLPLHEVGFRSYSQNDEDGILLYIFSLIGTTNKRCVELGVEEGIECNTANLIINHGWDALLFDGNRDRIQLGRAYYASHASTLVSPPKLVSAWITVENVNELISQNGFEGVVDLLSIDMDGVDFWIWKAITCIDPRVVVVEFVGEWGPAESVTVPYSAAFKYDPRVPHFRGASLMAFTKLAKERGYRLVGCERNGFNAFFVKESLCDNRLPAKTPEECFQPPNMSPRPAHSWRSLKSELGRSNWQDI